MINDAINSIDGKIVFDEKDVLDAVENSIGNINYDVLHEFAFQFFLISGVGAVLNMDDLSDVNNQYLDNHKLDTDRRE